MIFFYDIDDLGFTSFPDDNTPYSYQIFDWFTVDFLKGNADECHLIIS